jgi:DNA-directed RNA polymerase specialized sigma24 family protein
MGQSNHEPPHSISWMLHSAHVENAALAEVLVSEFYTGLYAFGLSLSGHPELASSSGQAAIAQAISERHRFWNETSLCAWLYRLTYRNLQKKTSLSKLINRIGILGIANFPPVKKTSTQSKALGLDPQDEILLLLSYGHDLEDEEIAYVVQVEPSDIHTRLNRCRTILYRAAYPTSQFSVDHFQLLELSYPAKTDPLPSAEQNRIDQHMAGCPPCQEFS